MNPSKRGKKTSLHEKEVNVFSKKMLSEGEKKDHGELTCSLKRVEGNILEGKKQV